MFISWGSPVFSYEEAFALSMNPNMWYYYARYSVYKHPVTAELPQKPTVK
jgi:hypothetical protein